MRGWMKQKTSLDMSSLSPKTSSPTSLIGQALSTGTGETSPAQSYQQGPQQTLPRWVDMATKTGRANPVSQSLDNINYNNGSRRNVSSDDWFTIGSQPNYKDFF